MEYLNQARRESLVRAVNDLGETPLHLAVSFTGSSARRSGGRGGGRGEGGVRSSRAGGIDQREADFAVQVRHSTHDVT